MSTVFVDTIKNQAGTTSLAANKLPDMLSGSGKSWCYFNTSSPTSITGGFNISSLEDLGTGNTNINITNAMANANDISMQATSNNFQAHNPSTPTATEFWFYSSTATGAANDGTRNYFTLHGDLA